MEVFFQSSLPRAGSTLLQNIIGQNPDFYVTPTSGVLELLYVARKNYSDLPEFKAQDQEIMKQGWLSFCKNGLNGFYKGITDKPYVVDKSRGWGIHYNFINSFHPNPKIICMVRDLRDIFTSMEKNFRKNQHLNHKLINHNDLEGTTTEKRVDIWAKTPPIGLAIERIYQIIREGIDKKILFIRYEDLTHTPQQELEKIYNFLEVTPFKHDFNNVEQLTYEDDSVYGIFGDHTIKQKVEPTPSQSNIILGEIVSQNIKNNYKWFYDYFNYP